MVENTPTSTNQPQHQEEEDPLGQLLLSSAPPQEENFLAPSSNQPNHTTDVKETPCFNSATIGNLLDGVTDAADQ